MDTNTATDTTADTTTDIDALELQLQEALKKVTRACDGPFYVERACVQTPAHELWRAATKQGRHEERLNATLAAARLTAAKWGISISPTTELRSAHAGVLLALLVDALGLGGHLGLEGAATARPGDFTRLGKGRKQGSDYPCWAYAAQLAWAMMNPQSMRVAILVYPTTEDGPGSVVLDVEGVGEATIPAHRDMAVLLGRLLLQSLGMMGEVHPLVQTDWALTGHSSLEEREIIETAYNAAVRSTPPSIAATESSDLW